MTAAVHAHAQNTSRTSVTSTSPVDSVLVLNSTALSTAGFSNNDDVIVFLYYTVAASSSNEIEISFEYNGTQIIDGPAANPHKYDLGSSGRERSFGVMVRVSDLGTLANFELLGGTTAATGYIENAEIFVILASEFGTENTDWFWNEDATDTGHTSSYSGTNRATVTWTPGSVEDWVYFANAHFAIDTVSLNLEFRTVLDSVFDSGDPSMEGESGSEFPNWLWFNYLSSLSASSHTLTVESRDDGSGTQNLIGQSSLLVFKASKWADIYYAASDGTSVANTTDVQVATVTDTLSTSQNLLIFGQQSMAVGISTKVHLWVENGGTPINPDHSSGGIGSTWSYDNSDESFQFWQGYVASASGTLDLDLITYQNDGTTNSAIRSKLLVWGMELAGAGGTPVSDTLQLIYDVDAAVSDTLQLVYDTLDAVPDTLQLVYDTLAAVPDTVQLIYDTLAAVPDTLEIIYDTLALGSVSDALQLIYDVYDAVPDSMQMVYDTLDSVPDTLQLVYDVLTPATNDLEIVYDTLATLSDTLQMVYDTLDAISDELQIVYDTNVNATAVSDALQLIWTTLEKAGEALQVVYNTWGTAITLDAIPTRLRKRGQFRRSPDGTLRLVPLKSRKGWSPYDGWDIVSDGFYYNHDIYASFYDAVGEAWEFNKTADADTLKTAINAALTASGASFM